MAVSSSPAAKISRRSEEQKTEKKKKTPTKKKTSSSIGEEALKHQENSDTVSPMPPKRNKFPGVRVQGNRVYDSTNGTTCHQCRQKTMDVAAHCKNQKQNSLCTMKFCQKCLLNRYGEKVEEVETLENWSCPKCREICNCSNCRKKRGEQPTGQLTRTAKSTGFSSVSELLNVKGSKSFVYKKIVKDVALPQKEAVIASPRKRGKENSFDGKMDINTDVVNSTVVEKKPKKMKVEELKKAATEEKPKKMKKEEFEKAAIEEKPKKMKKEGLEKAAIEVKPMKMKKKGLEKAAIEEKPKKMKKEGLEKPAKRGKDDDGNAKKAKKMKTSELNVTQVCNVTSKKPQILNENKNADEKDLNGLDQTKNQQDGDCTKTLIDSFKSLEVERLPEGKELTMVAGADLAPEHVGSSLQFLEFCATFGKILNINKGQAEAVLREMTNGRSGRRGKYSTVVQFHIHLLTFLYTDSEERSEESSSTLDKSSWLQDLKECITKSNCTMDSVILDHLDGKQGGYDALEFSQKNKILNFLCDEILETEKIRSWIDEENTRFSEKEKELKEKLNAAKDKEKQMKQKITDEVAKTAIANNGAPLTIVAHDAVISEIKSKAAEAHAQMLESKNVILNKNQRSDAIRTESIFKDDSSCAYWKLKCYSKGTEIIRQDVGTGDEKWYGYDTEQQKQIEKHISVRVRQIRPHRAKGKLPVKSAKAM